MHLTSHIGIVAMDQRIHKALQHRPFRIIGKLHPAIRRLFPTLFRIVFDKLLAVLQQRDEASAILLVIAGFHHAGCLIQTVPTGTKQAGLTHRRVVRKQNARIRESPVPIHQTKGDEIGIGQIRPRPAFINRTKFGKTQFRKYITRRQTVIGLSAPF